MGLRSYRLFTLLVGMALILAACGSDDGGGSGSTTKVRFMVANPVINLGHTQLAVAKQKGYFKDNSVDVEYLTSDGTVATVQALAAGTTDMGQIDTLSLDTAIAQGVEDVVAVCSYVANNIYYLAVPAGSPIQSAEDLKGKKIGLSSLGTGVFFNAKVMVEDAGLDPEEDVEFITIQQAAAQLDALQKGTVDALSIIDVTVATFQNQGVELRTLQATGPMQWQWNLVGARKDFLEKNKDAVAAVCKSIQQAEVYVATSPAAALKQFKAWGGDVGTTPDDQAINIIDFRAQGGFKAYAEGNERWGWMNVDQMDELANLYHDLGLLKSQVSVKGHYVSDLVDQIQPDAKKISDEANKDGSS